MNEKIEQLNMKIEKFKLESDRVNKLRKKYEDLLKNLSKQMEEYKKSRENEMKEFEYFKLQGT